MGCCSKTIQLTQPFLSFIVFDRLLCRYERGYSMNPILPPMSYFNRDILQAVVSILYEAAMFRASTQSLSKQVGHYSSRYGVGPV
jgi:hypothetical protein